MGGVGGQGESVTSWSSVDNCVWRLMTSLIYGSGREGYRRGAFAFGPRLRLIAMLRGRTYMI